MALNKYMHPRNIYKNPPDFKVLAKTYNEFSAIARTDITGKVSIDFKDPHSLQVLTKCLLKHDFNLDVVIPEDRLVPTLPSRLNYILWIEDVLSSIHRDSDIHGLDIGTGACAIYPLLAATKNKWHMVGTETDEGSLRIAQDNVNRNNLQGLVEVRKNPSSSLIEYLFTNRDERNLDFCMCNPPFYSSIQELFESRSPARPPPKNGFTGSPHELITEGGELEFCRKLIRESKQHTKDVLIFTTMVGHKINLHELLEDLKMENINHTHTEFCQGRVTRWGVAWTFYNYELNKLVPPRDKPRKKSLPVAYLLPELPNSVYDVETVTKKIISILNELKMTHKVLNKFVNNITMDIVATENTWAKQRRKRRLMKRLEESKRLKRDNTKDIAVCEIQYGSSESVANMSNVTTDSVNSTICQSNTNSEKCTEESSCDPGSDKPIVHAFLKLLRRDSGIILELDYLNGTAGKECLHQIIQYIKNNWK